MSSVSVDIEGLTDAESYFKNFPKVTAQAAAIAINYAVSRGGLKMLQDEMLGQVSFPSGYLSGDRFGPSEFASPTKLEGAVKARKRATSLARFAAPGTPLGRTNGSVQVRVKTGRSTTLRNAWLVRLRKGASLTEDNYNVGLAVRVGKGERLAKKYSEHRSWLVPGAIALLYGPSVDQVFKDVAEVQSSRILDMTSAEFFRQLERLL